MTSPISTPIVTAVNALPTSITPQVTTGEAADTVAAYNALKAIVAWINAAKSASDLTTGTLPAARIADGSLALTKLAVDIATQAEADVISAKADNAVTAANSAVTAATTPPTLLPKVIPGAYTFILADTDWLLRSTSTTPVTYTVPLNSSVAFAVGRQITGFQGAAGAITFASAVGVNVIAYGNLKTSGGLGANFTLTKVGTNEWLLSLDAAV